MKKKLMIERKRYMVGMIDKKKIHISYDCDKTFLLKKVDIIKKIIIIQRKYNIPCFKKGEKILRNYKDFYETITIIRFDNKPQHIMHKKCTWEEMSVASISARKNNGTIKSDHGNLLTYFPDQKVCKWGRTG